MQRRLNITSSTFILRFVLATWIVIKCIGYPVWFATRSFPLSPVLDIFHKVPQGIHAGLFFSGILLMGVCIGWKTEKKLLCLLMAAEIFSCLLDQQRWQPYEYQFLLMLLVFVCCKQEEVIATGWKFMIAVLYFFSGLGKLQPAFLHDVWQTTLLHQWLGLRSVPDLLLKAGYLFAAAEMIGGLLLFSKFRRVAVTGLCMMHLILLLALGPFGNNYNSVVWPWNLLMCFLLIALFFQNAEWQLNKFLLQPAGWMIVLLCGILPWAGFAGKWDNYLSFQLYRGGLPQLYIYTNDPVMLKELLPYQTYRRGPDGNVHAYISISIWAEKEMRTAYYPQLRVYRSIAQQIRNRYPLAAMEFYVYRSGFAERMEILPGR